MPIYPLLLGAWLLLVQWRQGEASVAQLGDLGTSLLATALTGLIGILLARAVATDPARRGLVALTVVVWSALFGSFTVSANTLAMRWPTGDLALAWTACCILALLGARRLPVSAQFTRALTIGSAVLVTFQVVGIVPQLRPPARTGANGVGRSAERPDIYVIVLDKYSASRWLQSRYGFDNRPFEDSLRALGFELPTDARTNYPHTSLVLASLLDGNPVHLTVNDPEAKWSAVMQRVDSGAMVAALRQQGYRYVFFPTTFAATARSSTADVVMASDRKPPPAPFRTWRNHAPLDALLQLRCGRRGCRDDGATAMPTFPYPLEGAETILAKFGLLTTLPDSAGPLFVLFHALVPHEPYQFSDDCSVKTPWWPLSDSEADSSAAAAIRDAYLAQVNCANALVLRSVTTLLERSSVPPVILIQSDHGHGMMTEDAMAGRTVPMSALDAEQLRERTDVFAAYRVPQAPGLFPAGVTPASVLPRTLNALFGLGLSVPSDATWWVDNFRQPLRVTPFVDALRLSTGAPPSP